MKSLITTVAAAALIFAASSAFAAPDRRDGDHSGGHPAGGSHSGGHAAPAQHGAPAQAPPSHFAQPGSGGINRGMHMQTRDTTNTTASHGADLNSQTRGNNDNRNATRHYSGNNNSNYRNDGNNSNNRSYSNNSNRGNANGHADFNRRNVTARHHYHYRGGDYRGPSGYAYRRWAYGDILPSIYWGRDYWIDDYYDYGLADPPPGCVWVRYGNDAVLIDEDSGEILEVVYDQFY